MSKPSILVVEDEQIVARDIHARLERQGYQVAGVVASGEEAVAAAGGTTPDLVLMDIMLQGAMDGIAAAELIRERHGIPVVYLTAFADERTLQRAKISEPFGYLLKPFEERELHITIQMALYKHGMECRMREHEQWLATTLRSIGDAVVSTDLDGHITFMNPRAEALTGWNQEDARGRRLEEVVVHLRDRAEIVAPSGTRTPVEATVSEIRNDRGERWGTVHVFRDITERRHAQEALRESMERYRLFFEQDLTGDYEASADGALISCNPAFARILGFGSPEEASRRAFLEELLAKGSLEYNEREVIRPDGKTLHLVENVIGVTDEQGRLVRIRGYIFDDTRRKQLEDQLRQALKMESIGTLASGIAHDFNNILNNVLGFAQQIKKHASDAEKVARYAQTVERSATRGAELSAQLLSFARLGRKEKVRLAVPEVLKEVAHLCRETFPASIDLDLTVDRELHPVQGDRTGLYQVLLNLAVNARDALLERADGRAMAIAIQARNVDPADERCATLPAPSDAGCVEIVVRDNGAGIPPAIRDKIFDPFFTTKEKGKGTGLGLATVYNVVRSHGGTILLETEEGKGTAFTILLPADSAAAVDAGNGIEKLRPRRPARVLLVDDDEAMLELGRELLREVGYEVVVAEDGRRALDIYRAHASTIDLVILDLVMPEMDGGETYLAMKEVRPDLRAMFCTGYLPEQVVGGLLREEDLRAIQKPFEPAAFLSLVREVLEDTGGVVPADS
jgi:signal transduction histidine kinase/DNA-binding response OmpR family regulator